MRHAWHFCSLSGAGSPRSCPSTASTRPETGLRIGAGLQPALALVVRACVLCTYRHLLLLRRCLETNLPLPDNRHAKQQMQK